MLLIQNIGIRYADLGEYDKALSYFKECELIALNTKSDYGYALSLINLGSCYFHLNEYKTAFNNYNKALVISRKNDFKENVTYAFFKMAEIYSNKKQYDLAELWLLKADSSMVEIDDITLDKSVYHALYTRYENIDNQKLSLKYLPKLAVE